jgi:apolipoprotein N-acyltransferase
MSEYMNDIRAIFNRFYGPAFLTGLLLFLSFPKIDLYMFAWVALTPLLIFLYDLKKKEAFKAGFLAGAVYFFGTTYWIYHSLHYYGSIPLVPSLFLVLLLSLYLSLYPALFSYFYSSLIRKTDFPALFIAPVLWTTLEFVRSYALTGFPWSSLGYSQYKFLHAIQIADLTGVYGVSFLIVAINGAVADIFLLKKRKLDRPLYSLIPTAAGFISLLIIIIATFSYGFYRLYSERGGTQIRAAVVQGNIEQDKKWDPDFKNKVIATYKELSMAAADEKPDIIIWPESSVPFIFKKDEERTDDLISFQKELNSYLLFGSILVKEKNDTEERTNGLAYTNSAVLLDKNGNISFTYDKMHLVPFGEYVPLRELLFFIDKLAFAFGAGDFIPGSTYNTAETTFGSFGVPICYEIIFPGLVRKFYTQGGNFIVTITNDAWFGDTSGPYQHFNKAVFRAIENRKPVIRAANTGISGFIDSNGRIIAKTALFDKTFMVKDIYTDKTRSVYTKYGDIFSFLCIVCSLLLLMRKYYKFI